LYFSIIYRAFFIVLISLVIPQTIFSQLDDIGITIQKNPGHTVRDSLDFFIIEGSSPIFNQNIEGAAINIAGDEIESVTFTVNDGQNNTYAVDGDLFVQPDNGNTIATFLREIRNVPIAFSYKIISKKLTIPESIIIFQ